MKRVFNCFLILALVSAPVWARPLTTDDATIHGLGHWEGQVYDTVNTYKNAISTNTIGVQITNGILPNCDLKLEIPTFTSNVSGIGDAIIHTKYLFYQNGDNRLAARVDFKLPSGNAAAGLGSGYANYVLWLAGATKLGPVKVYKNLVYSSVGTAAGAPTANYYQLSVAGEYPIDKWTAASEIIWNNSVAPNVLTILVGGNYAITPAIVVDAGLTFGLTSQSQPYVFTCGLTQNI